MNPITKTGAKKWICNATRHSPWTNEAVAELKPHPGHGIPTVE